MKAFCVFVVGAILVLLLSSALVSSMGTGSLDHPTDPIVPITFTIYPTDPVYPTLTPTPRRWIILRP